jgi:hypothetical protein
MFFVFGAFLFSSIAFAAIVSGTFTIANSNNVTYTQVTVSKPASTVTDDFMLAQIVVNGGSTMTIVPPSGWTLIARTNNGSNVALVSYYKVAGASEPSAYIWNVASQTRGVGGITRYTGVDISNPVDQVSAASGHSTTAAAPSVTTTASNDRLVAVYAMSAGLANTGHFSTPTGMTEKYDTANVPMGPSLAQDEAPQVSVGASGQKSSTISGFLARDWAAQLIALRQVPPVSLTTGIVSYWKFDESAGNAADSVSTNTLTNVNDVMYKSGKIGNGAQFVAASSTYLTIPDASQVGLDLSSALTIAGWVKFDSLPTLGNYMYVVSKWRDGDNSGASYFLSLQNTLSGYSLYSALADESNIYDVRANWTPVVGTWYHIVVTWSASAGVAKLYVNGSQIGTDVPISLSRLQDNPVPFKVGANADSAGNSYQFQDGMIDEVGVWNRALNANEIGLLYSGGTGTTYPF